MADDLLLAIETSTRIGSIALADGETLLEVRCLSANRRHAAELLPAIRDLLAGSGNRLADVGVFAYSCGPGSFTGLRVAATIGQMIQSAVGCGVVAVPTLEVMARNALSHPERPGRVVTLLDAKRGQVYGGVYQRRESGRPTARAQGAGQRAGLTRGSMVPIVEPGLYEPAALLAAVETPFWILGEGAGRHAGACTASKGRLLDESYWAPSAEHVIAIARRMAAAGLFCKPEQIVPLYLRPPECEEVYEQRRSAARRKRGE